MGYPRDLQDYEDHELVRELERRVSVRRQKLCDYCGRSPEETPCRYPNRHYRRQSEIHFPGPEPLSFETFHLANRSRQQRWPGADRFVATDLSNEMAGEVGEACNVVKKLRRAELGVVGNSEEVPDLLGMLADELGDVITTADLLANHFDIDLGAAAAAKFNKVSAKHGFPERL